MDSQISDTQKQIASNNNDSYTTAIDIKSHEIIVDQNALNNYSAQNSNSLDPKITTNTLDKDIVLEQIKESNVNPVISVNEIVEVNKSQIATADIKSTIGIDQTQTETNEAVVNGLEKDIINIANQNNNSNDDNNNNNSNSVNNNVNNNDNGNITSNNNSNSSIHDKEQSNSNNKNSNNSKSNGADNININNVIVENNSNGNIVNENNNELIETYKLEVESLESSLLESEYELSNLRLSQLIEKQHQNKIQYTMYMKDIEIHDLKENYQVSRNKELLSINNDMNLYYQETKNYIENQIEIKNKEIQQLQDKYNNDVHSYQESIKELRSENQNLEISLFGCKNEIIDIEDKNLDTIAEIKDSYEKQIKTINDHHLQIVHIKDQEILKFEDQLSIIKEKYSNSKKSIEKLKVVHKDQFEQLENNKNQEISNIEELKSKEILELNEIITRLKLELSQTTGQQQGKRDEQLQSLRDEVTKLVEKNSNYKKSIEIFKNEHREQIRILEQSKNDEISNIKQLNIQEVSKLNEIISKLKVELSQTTGHQQGKRDEQLQSLRDEVTKLVEKNSSLKKSIEKSNKENELLINQQKDKFTNEINQIEQAKESELSELNETITRLKLELSQTTGHQQGKRDEQLQSLRDEVTKLMEKNSSLKKSIEKSNKDLEIIPLLKERNERLVKDNEMTQLMYSSNLDNSRKEIALLRDQVSKLLLRLNSDDSGDSNINNNNHNNIEFVSITNSESNEQNSNNKSRRGRKKIIEESNESSEVIDNTKKEEKKPRSNKRKNEEIEIEEESQDQDNNNNQEVESESKLQKGRQRKNLIPIEELRTNTTTNKKRSTSTRTEEEHQLLSEKEEEEKPKKRGRISKKEKEERDRLEKENLEKEKEKHKQEESNKLEKERNQKQKEIEKEMKRKEVERLEQEEADRLEKERKQKEKDRKRKEEERLKKEEADRLEADRLREEKRKQKEKEKEKEKKSNQENKENIINNTSQISTTTSATTSASAFKSVSDILKNKKLIIPKFSSMKK